MWMVGTMYMAVLVLFNAIENDIQLHGCLASTQIH